MPSWWSRCGSTTRASRAWWSYGAVVPWICGGQPRVRDHRPLRRRAYAHYASGVSSAVVTVQVRSAYATLGVYAFGSVAAEQGNHLIRCANTKLAKTLDFRTFGAGTGGEERVLLDAMRRRGGVSCPARWNASACS